MKFKISFKNESGQMLIVTVLIVSAISTLLLVSLGISSRALFSTNQNLEYSKIAFLTTEGAVQETLQHAQADADWPGSPTYSDSYTLGDVDITRSITTTANSVTYEITGEFRNAQRQITVIENLLTDTFTFSESVP